MTSTNAHRSADEFLSIADVADLLGCNAYTVRRMIARGELRATRFGRLIRITRADVERAGRPVTPAELAYAARNH